MDGLADLLGENPRLAPDVHFRVTEEVLVDGILEEKTEVVGAHKFVLAMLSDVFKTLFFGPMRDENDEIDITGTTIEAFKEFLKILYSLHTSSCETSIIQAKPLFEILNLCKRYIVQPAVAFIEERIMSMKFTPAEPESVITSAVVANDYKELEGFQAISRKLLQSCSVFLNECLTTMYQVRKFLARVETLYSSETVCLLVRLLTEKEWCPNCKAPRCFHGNDVTRENVVHDAKVRVIARVVNDEGDEWVELEELVGKIDTTYYERNSLRFPSIYIDVGDGGVFDLDKDGIIFECSEQ